MGCSGSKRVAPPRERLPRIWVEDPSDYPSIQKQYRSVRHLDHLQPFFALKARISETSSQYGYPQSVDYLCRLCFYYIQNIIRKYLFQSRGDMGLLASTKSQSVYHPPTCPDRLYTEENFHHLNDIISHHSEMGIMREETKGLSHPDTLHSFLQVAEAYYHLGQDDKAQPLLEQVYILGDEKSRPEFTIEPAEILNYIYLKSDFQKNLHALEKKALTPPPRRRK